MGKKADVRKKGSRYDKSVEEELKESTLEEDAEKKAPEIEAKEAVHESKPKSKGRFHLMFEV